MQGNTSSSVTRLKSSRSVVKVNTKTQENSEGEKLNSERSITYTVGNRFLSLKITKLRDSTTARVNGVSINLAEITGVAAGIYSGLTYGLKEARGAHDWKNSAVAGAITGATLALTLEDSTHEQIVQCAITGAAISTAANLLTGIF